MKTGVCDEVLRGGVSKEGVCSGGGVSERVEPDWIGYRVGAGVARRELGVGVLLKVAVSELGGGSSSSSGGGEWWVVVSGGRVSRSWEKRVAKSGLRSGVESGSEGKSKGKSEEMFRQDYGGGWEDREERGHPLAPPRKNPTPLTKARSVGGGRGGWGGWGGRDDGFGRRVEAQFPGVEHPVVVRAEDDALRQFGMERVEVSVLRAVLR